MERLFPVGTPVVGKDLVGREKEISLLSNYINIGQSVVILGPRRLGKTSLILEMIERIKSRFFTCYIDIFKVTTIKGLAESIIDAVYVNKNLFSFVSNAKKNIVQLMKQVQTNISLGDVEITLKLLGEENDQALFEHALNLVEEFSRKFGKPIVVFFDEFSDIMKLNGEKIVKKMRSIIQLQKNSIYVFSGSQEGLMKEVFANNKSAFYRFARIIEIGNLDEKQLSQYIRDKFNTLKVKIEENALEYILKKFRAHPYYTQLVCQNLYLILLRTHQKIINLSCVHQGFKEAFIEERSYIEEVWDKIKNRKDFGEVLRIIAHDGNPYEILKNKLVRQQIYNIVSELERSGHIKRIEKGKYFLTDPFLKAFLTEELTWM